MLSRGGDDVRRAPNSGKEGEFTDRLAWADLGDRLLLAIGHNHEAPRDDQIEAIGRITCPHKRRPPGEPSRSGLRVKQIEVFAWNSGKVGHHRERRLLVRTV